jgi:hypothetical protein
VSAQLRRKLDFDAPARGVGVNGAPRHGHLQHFLEAKGLGAQLQRFMTMIALWSRFVFNGKRGIAMEFDEVGFAGESQFTGEKGQRPQAPHPIVMFLPWVVNPIVEPPTA